MTTYRRSEEEEMIDTPAGIIQYLNSGFLIRGNSARRTSDGGVNMSVIVKGSIAGTTQEVEFQTNDIGHQLVAPGELAYTELVRRGNGWQTMQTSATAALVARPTTLTGIEIWNGSATVSLVIDRLFSHELVTSTTGLGGGAIIYAMVTVPVAAGPAITALTVRGSSGKAYSGGVRTGVGTTVVDNGWFPWGTGVKKESAGAVVPGGGLVAEVNGRIIVPPFASLCVTVVSGYAADTFTSGASWFEKVFPSTYPLL